MEKPWGIPGIPPLIHEKPRKIDGFHGNILENIGKSYIDFHL
jgi:hypothetical protein